jgi:hypothetical protein
MQLRASRSHSQSHPTRIPGPTLRQNHRPQVSRHHTRSSDYNSILVSTLEPNEIQLQRIIRKACPLDLLIPRYEPSEGVSVMVLKMVTL